MKGERKKTGICFILVFAVTFVFGNPAAESIAMSQTNEAVKEESKMSFDADTLIIGCNTENFDKQGAEEVISIGQHIYALSFLNCIEAESAYQLYQHMSGITFVEPNLILEPEDIDNTTEIVEDIKTETGKTERSMQSEQVSKSEEYEGRAVITALIDTGADINNLLISPYLAEKSVHTEDQNGHGTKIAGLLASAFQKVGLTPEQVKILPVQVTDQTGKCTILQLYLGMKYAMDYGADILNISMGTKVMTNSILLEQAVEEADGRGILVVVSAGNGGADVSCYTPANLQQVITVGSVNQAKNISAFSNHGKTLDCVSYGENIRVFGLGGKEETESGTSFAAALVTADLAEQMVSGTIRTPKDADAYIQNHAEDLGTTGWDDSCGYGFLALTSLTFGIEDQSETDSTIDTGQGFGHGIEDTEKETETGKSSESIDKTVQIQSAVNVSSGSTLESYLEQMAANTITLQKNCIITGCIMVAGTKTINMNGYKIYLAEEHDIETPMIVVQKSAALTVNGTGIIGGNKNNIINYDNLIAVAAGGTLTVSNVTLQNAASWCSTKGDGTTSCLYNSGSVTLTGCTVTGCDSSMGYTLFNNSGANMILESCSISDNAGGAIGNMGSLVIKGTTDIHDNTPPGEADTFLDEDASQMGGISNNTNAAIYISGNCNIYNNYSYSQTGGGISNSGTIYIGYSNASTTAAVSVAVYHNKTGSMDGTTYVKKKQGAGISNKGTMYVSNQASLQVYQNSCTNDGGGIYNSGTFSSEGTLLVYSNSSLNSQDGGGIYNASTGTFSNTGILRIYANTGGGFFNDGTATFAGTQTTFGFSDYTSITKFTPATNSDYALNNHGTCHLNTAARMYQSGTETNNVINNGGSGVLSIPDAQNVYLVCENTEAGIHCYGSSTISMGNVQGAYPCTIKGSAIYGLENNSTAQWTWKGCVDGGSAIQSNGDGTWGLNAVTGTNAFTCGIMNNIAGNLLVADGVTTKAATGINNRHYMSISSNYVYANSQSGVVNDTGAYLSLNSGFIYGNGDYGVYNSGTCYLASQSTPTGLQVVYMGLSSCNSYIDYTSASNTSGNIYNDTSGTLQLGGNQTKFAYARLVSDQNTNITNKGIITCPGNTNWDQSIVLWGTGTGIANSGMVTISAGVTISNFTSAENRIGVDNSGTLNIKGGYINKGKTGINNTGTVNMSGGAIEDNISHGVYQNGTFNMSGSAVVNINNDVCLAYGKVITVNGALTTNGVVADITPLKSGNTDLEFRTGKIVAQIAYKDSNDTAVNASEVLFYTDTEGNKQYRFLLSNAGILRPGDYMDKEVVQAEQTAGTVDHMIADTDIAISKAYSITYDGNIHEKATDGSQADVQINHIPPTQSKYWCEDLKLPNGSDSYAKPEVVTEAYSFYKFLNWNASADGSGTAYELVYTYKANQNLALYAQWQKDFNIAYIGNQQTSGEDLTDDDISPSEEYQFYDNEESTTDTEHFKREVSREAYTDTETGETVSEDITSKAVGWSFDKNKSVGSKIYSLGESVDVADMLAQAKLTPNCITYGAPNGDYGNTAVDCGYLSLNESSSLKELSLFCNVSRNSQQYLSGSSDTSYSMPYVNLYMVWDDGPTIEAYDLYYTLEEAQKGTITEDELLSHATARDDELKDDINLNGEMEKGEDETAGTLFDVWDYQAQDFTSFAKEGSVTETYRAVDSAGNVTKKTITVHIVDSTAVDQEDIRQKVRFISGKYLDTLPADSIWNTDRAYHEELTKVLDNQRINTEKSDAGVFGSEIQFPIAGSGEWQTQPQESWSFTSAQVKEVQDYVDAHGYGKMKETDGLGGFITAFASCRMD